MISKNNLLIYFALIFLGLGVLLIFQLKDLGKFKMIACDVGQGDGLLLISPGGKQVVVDGGAGKKILDCLSSHMPFWDRKVEMMVSTHPQKDHMEGLVAILGRYKVDMIVATGVVNKTQLFAVWQEEIKKSGARVYIPGAGDKFKVDALDFDVLWPSWAKASEWQANAPRDLNETSIVMRASYGDFCVYLTGDLPKEILAKIIDKPCQVLKVVHHGSRTGTDQEVIDAIRPQLAIIQVGAKNQYGHPHKEVLDVLTANGVKILRNDLNGEIEVDSDGRGFSYRLDR
ncbi:MAG: hypothetical protein Q7S45_00035 [Candidatus Curtissbacteria bacterium]|nr:hypothetical protein [Candidatus Curtissbacteria bacterium]